MAVYEQEKKEILECALEMKRNRLVSLSGGNVSMRVAAGYLVTPSGMVYEKMVPDDVVLIDGAGKVLEGNRKPSSDWSALVYMFENLPHINALIHTHQPWATAAGFITDEVPAFLVTIIDACRKPVKVAPFRPSSDIGMGKIAVEYVGDSLAVILKHHGVIALGEDLEQALFSAVYLEEACQTYVLARSVCEIPALSEEDIAKEAAGWLQYGQ